MPRNIREVATHRRYETAERSQDTGGGVRGQARLGVERPATMPSAQERKRRAQRKWDRNRSESVRGRNRQNSLSNYHVGRQRESLSAIDALAAAGATAEKGTAGTARRQRESLEAIDARAAAGATSKKGTAGTAPLSKESKQPEPIQVSL